MGSKKHSIMGNRCLASSTQWEKLVQYIPLPTIVVIGLRKSYTKMEVGAGLELINVYLRLAVQMLLQINCLWDRNILPRS